MSGVSEATMANEPPLPKDDNYVAWLCWAGDESHRHLKVCDSDTQGAFKVYRKGVSAMASERLEQELVRKWWAKNRKRHCPYDGCGNPQFVNVEGVLVDFAGQFRRYVDLKDAIMELDGSERDGE